MLKQKLKIFLILTLFLSGFFCLHHNCWAANFGDVVINEVMYNPQGSDTGNEWIEIYNTSLSDINLTDWRFYEATTNHVLSLEQGDWILPVDSYAVIGDNAEKFLINNPNFKGTIFDSSFSLNNTSETIALKDNESNIIDEITYLDSKGGDNNNKSIERQNNENWTESSLEGGTPGAQNSDGKSSHTKTSEDNFESQPESSSDNLPSSISPYEYGDILINEFVSDPADGEVEFVELYNNCGMEVDMEGWYLYEGSGAKTVLSGAVGNSGSSRFLTITKPKGNLNNKGDIIVLKYGDIIIDEVAYGDWDDGSINDNAPLAKDPYSVARRSDGLNTNNNAEDFAITSVVTKGAENIIFLDSAGGGSQTEAMDADRENYQYSNDIMINEVFPNPKGRDNEKEWIELFNKGGKDINLEGWALGDSGKRKYELKSKNLEDIIIEAGGYFVVYRKESRIALNNTGGEEVKLYQPLKDEFAHTVRYEKAKEDWSYACIFIDDEERWEWTESITPGKANAIKLINNPPDVDFYYFGEQRVGQIIFFDSSDTDDEEGEELFYLWDFGGLATSTDANPIFIFLEPGEWPVKLSISDGENEVEAEKMIEIATLKGEIAPTPSMQSIDEIREPHLQKEETEIAKVIISEFLPNPEGSNAEGEWIEIRNLTDETINLIDWQIDDEEGGSRPYTIKNDILIESNGFYVFDRGDTGLALNNTGDSARLFNNLEELIDEASYGDVLENASYARVGDAWFWTMHVTPGEENIIEDLPREASKTSNSTSGKTIAETTLENIREFEKGDLVKVTGVAAVLPGIFSTQYFYIVGSPGVQIYNYKKAFPDLNIGDVVEVSGELTETYRETRLKTKEAEDIQVIGIGLPPEPVITECDKINEGMEAQLVRLHGEVVEKKGSTVWLDDGNSEIGVYIKTGTKINKSKINEGDVITVIGIVSQKNDKYQILPRSQEDIIREGSGEKQGEVLGEISISDEWKLSQNNKKLKLMQYLLIIAGGLIVVLAGMVWKGRK